MSSYSDSKRKKRVAIKIYFFILHRAIEYGVKRLPNLYFAIESGILLIKIKTEVLENETET